ncbi:heavy metal translocating P-type ATPase [Chromatiaceae bacterium AAb-1]|nr:heavy metal translocating P-type ATPase [Chromatiaceae bacterium AAb-1]
MQAVQCFHCHEPVLTGQRFRRDVEGELKLFCCAGCLAVADTIIENGLGDYYRFRTTPASKASAMPEDLAAELTNYDTPDVLADISIQKGDLTEIELSVSGMSCAACAWLIEKQLRQLPAIARVTVNSSTQRCYLQWRASQLPLSQLISKISQLGYHASPFVADQEEHIFKAELNRYLKRLAVSGIMSMQVMMLAVGLYFGEYTGIDISHQGYLRWISLLLTIPVVFYAAMPFARSAWRGIKARQMNMDVPVTLAIYYTFIASSYATLFNTGEVYFESVCMFTFLLQLGKFFEYRARAQARDATSNLLKIMPVSATLLQGEQQETVSARRLKPGDLILVKPGEIIAADGMVTAGSSSADESMLTGEYRAISKQPGDAVLAGSINHDGLLQVRISQPLLTSRLGQIIQLQQQTFSQKPRLVEKTDRMAKFFVERLLVIAAATFILWYFWLDADRAFWVTLSVLVATCPCALSLAIPTAITCSLANLNRKGVLIKNSQILETLPQLTHIIFDKTGTLTQGHFSVSKVTVFNSSYTEAAVLNLLANIEKWSEHPIAKAFYRYQSSELLMENVAVTVGGGITATFGQQQLKAGSARFCGITTPVNAMVYLTIDNQLIAAIELADGLRPEIPALIASLRQKGYQLGMLTGDSSEQADQLQQQLSLDFIAKGCSPEDKVAAINKLVQQGYKVLMMGDGINDSPSFHAAHVSVALQSGTDLSKNQADVVLLQNNLGLLEKLLDGGKATERGIKQNLWWTIGYNLTIVPLAVAGFVSPYIAVIGMSFSSLLVVSNSLRLLKK